MNNREIVQTCLAQAGLPASPEEIETIAAGYNDHRAQILSLYAVEAARYESPCLVFEPNPTSGEWG